MSKINLHVFGRVLGLSQVVCPGCSFDAEYLVYLEDYSINEAKYIEERIECGITCNKCGKAVECVTCLYYRYMEHIKIIKNRLLNK